MEILNTISKLKDSVENYSGTEPDVIYFGKNSYKLFEQAIKQLYGFANLNEYLGMEVVYDKKMNINEIVVGMLNQINIE